jgi:hypothetical protein
VKVGAAEDETTPVDQSSQHTWRKPGLRLIAWLIFGVIMALLPLARSASSDVFVHNITPEDAFGDGELFVVAAVIAAGAVGEAVVAGLRTKDKLFPLLAFGGCFLCFVVNTIAYWALGSATASELSPHRVSSVSLWLFGIAVVASGSVIWLAEASNGN